MTEQSNQLEATICLINNCPDRDVYELFHRLIDVCCDTNQPSDFLSQRALLWNDRPFVDNYVDSVWPSESIFQSVCNYFIPHLYCLGNRLLTSDNEGHANHIFEKLSAKVQAIIQECIDTRRKELLKSIAIKTITSKHYNLVRYDWKVSVVMCGDRASKILEPLTKLDLILQTRPSLSQFSLDDSLDEISSELSATTLGNKEGKNTSVISFEFTKNDLKQFIKFLQEAKMELTQQFQLFPALSTNISTTTTAAAVTSNTSTSN